MYRRILVPIDGSDTATRGLEEAIAIGRLAGATLRLVHVLDQLVFVSGFETGSTYLDDVLPALRHRAEAVVAAARARADAAGVAVESQILECFGRRAADVVLDEAAAWPADLIVVGTHGRRGVGRALLGSDAEQSARCATVPVLLVRHRPASKDGNA
jgi:nucleotide-binding universal stress UspA family protein